MKIPTWYHRWEIMQRLPLILKELLEMEQQGLQLEVRTKPLLMQAELRHSNFEVMLLNPPTLPPENYSPTVLNLPFLLGTNWQTVC